MRVLLVDNSNGRTKWMLYAGTLRAETLRRETTAELTSELLRDAAAALEAEAVLISSVVPSCRPLFDDAFADLPHVFLSARQTLPVDFSSYPGASTLGADRIANVLGLLSLRHESAIAVDAGTAITYDVLMQRDGRPVFGGGVISPGFAALRDYLPSRTAQLPQVAAELPVHAVGQSTAEAMQGGIMFGFRGMVREILAELAAALGQHPVVIATGGDAELLHQLLPQEVNAADALLTFRGLSLAADTLFG